MKKSGAVVTSVRVDKELLMRAKRARINMSEVFARALETEVRRKKTESFTRLRKRCRGIRIDKRDVVKIIREMRESR